MGFPSLLAWGILQQAKLMLVGCCSLLPVNPPSLADGCSLRCHSVGLFGLLVCMTGKSLMVLSLLRGCGFQSERIPHQNEEETNKATPGEKR